MVFVIFVAREIMASQEQCKTTANKDSSKMRPSKTCSFLSFLILFPALVLTSPKSGRAEARQIDLSATLGFVENWATRDAFPESTSFAYYNTYCQLALGGKLDDEARKKVIETIQSCQQPDGGFSSEPTVKDANSIFTYYALKTLQLLDAIAAVDRDSAIRFVASLAQEDGSIKAKSEDKGASLMTTYYGVGSLAVLDAMDKLDKTRIVAYIEAHQQANGFGMKVGKPPAPQSTFAAVQMLDLLGGLTPSIRSGVVDYLKESRYSGLQEDKKYNTLPSIEDMAYVIETASRLSALSQLNTEKMREFVASLFIPENGGFGPSPGLGTTPPSTYFGVVCLTGLGELRRSNTG